MIKRAEEMITDLKHQMRGGNGTVELTHIFKQDELTGKARLFARITLKKGCSIGLHSHDAEEEIYYIIQGKAVVNDNGNITEIKAGDAVLTGNGASHFIENNEDEPMVMIAVILLFE
jgi:quercetin dioxygenase-like cupin family protein